MRIFDKERELMTFFKTLAASAAISVVALGASAQGWDPNRIITSVTSADMEAIITGAGHTVTRVIPADGSGGPIVVGQHTQNGLTFLLAGNACGGGDSCNGLEIIVLWDHNDRTRNPAVQMELNQVYAALKVMTTDSSIGVQRYLILDRGQTMDNIGFDVNVTLNLAADFQDLL